MTYIGVDAHSTFLVATTLRDDKKSRTRVDLENLELWAASLDPDAEVVLEASTNACHIHDVLLPHVKCVFRLRWPPIPEMFGHSVRKRMGHAEEEGSGREAADAGDSVADAGSLLTPQVVGRKRRFEAWGSGSGLPSARPPGWVGGERCHLMTLAWVQGYHWMWWCHLMTELRYEGAPH